MIDPPDLAPTRGHSYSIYDVVAGEDGGEGMSVGAARKGKRRSTLHMWEEETEVVTAKHEHLAHASHERAAAMEWDYKRSG